MYRLNVLDHGFVELVDHMGGDNAVARAARISYMSKGDKKADEKLINSLMRNGHHSPFEHAVMTFHIKAPIFVARHFVRHRIASWNELSARYTKLNGEFYLPTDANEAMKKQMQSAFDTYNSLIEAGIQKQIARLVLPLSIYTEWFWTLNVRSLMNVMDLRASPAAQEETAKYAIAMGELWQSVMPITFEAYLKHQAPNDSLLLNALP